MTPLSVRSPNLKVSELAHLMDLPLAMLFILCSSVAVWSLVYFLLSGLLVLLFSEYKSLENDEFSGDPKEMCVYLHLTSFC